MLSSTSRTSGGMSVRVAHDLFDDRLLERAEHHRDGDDERQPHERADHAGQRAHGGAFARR